MKTVFNFEKNADLSQWYIEEDQVMGGVSTGSISITDNGHGLFKGHVSLENNGGFSSVHYDLSKMKIEDYDTVSIRLKGDGKDYQFRISADDNDKFEYVKEFSTSGEWEEVKIPLKEFYPSYRGRKLDKPNFNHDYIDDIGILIGNKRNENFEILIDKIELK